MAAVVSSEFVFDADLVLFSLARCRIVTLVSVPEGLGTVFSFRSGR